MEKSQKNGLIFTVLKGTGVSLISTLIGVLIFAGLIKVAMFDTAVIKPVNQFIKVMSIFLGCFFTVRGSLGFLKGGLIGGLSTSITYLIFALIGGAVSFKLPFIIDLIFGIVIGMISGVISKSFKK